MNEIKRQQLTWNKGMTNVPSDLVCDDNTCEVELNMIYRQGEHRPIQNEQVLFGSAEMKPLLFVHKYNGYKHYIALNGSRIIWYDKDGKAGGDITNEPPDMGEGVQVEGIGNTLVVNSSKGLGYYLWKPELGNYKYLGSKVPEIEIRYNFYLEVLDSSNSIRSEIKGESIIKGIATGGDHGAARIELLENKEKDYENLVIGLYSKNKNEVAKSKGFCNPFFIRAAVEMFDGGLTSYTVPVLAFPCIGENSELSFVDKRSIFVTHFAKLRYKLKSDYTEWGDIVKKIKIGITKPVDLYDTEKYSLSRNSSGVYGIIGNVTSKYNSIGSLGSTGYYFYPFENMDVKTELKDSSVFYTLCELPLKSGDDWQKMEKYIRKNDLVNIDTQTIMGDDYYSNCNISAKDIYQYNGRLNFSNILRGFWAGPKSVICYDSKNTTTDYDIYVFIKSSNGEKIVHWNISTKEKIWQHYFFYPDPRAYKVRFVSGYNNTEEGATTGGVELILEEHPFLNGAYYLGDLPTSSDVDFPSQWVEGFERPVINDTAEELRNQVWTSEVNNPWVFTAKGNNTIGSGEVIGLASQTTALSQGQFGQYPLIAFCTDGIWALQTNSEGLYSAVHPMSREICNNANSITETDGYVFFTSEKGLMVVNGSQVSCVSDMMSGKVADSATGIYNGTLSEAAPLNLKEFLKECYIAYDYRDSLLWIFKGAGIAFIYNIKDGTFAMKATANVAKTINDYPDTLLQDKSGKVYSLLGREDINEDNDGYDCEIVSRPMKWENSSALKTLMRVKMIYGQNESLGAELKIYVSNDCKNWMRTLSLHGRGFKYWRFIMRFRTMRATDTFSGALITTQERYTARLR